MMSGLTSIDMFGHVCEYNLNTVNLKNVIDKKYVSNFIPYENHLQF